MGAVGEKIAGAIIEIMTAWLNGTPEILCAFFANGYPDYAAVRQGRKVAVSAVMAPHG
jgi:hypothetical protein